MNILVCVKQVPDSEGLITIDDKGTGIVFNGVYRMNRYDEYALEEALRIRERGDASAVDAVSVGPRRAASTLKRALEMGAADGIHIITAEGKRLTPFETASLIASQARQKEYGLILTGVMAEDDMHCQVGPMIAELLGYPCASSVIFEEQSEGGRRICVEREIEGGRRESLELSLPAVLTIQSGINRPRYPALSNVLRARAQNLIEMDAPSFAPPAPRERLTALRYPGTAAKGVFLEGTTAEKADALCRALHEKALI
jgi:electron transfer flavoprotein beta subunit